MNLKFFVRRGGGGWIGHIVARRYFNSRRKHFYFRPREIKGFVLVCLLIVVVTRPLVEPLIAALAGFLQQYGGLVAGLIILIAAGALYMGIQKRRNRRLEEEIRFRAVRLIDLHSINPTEFEEYVAQLLDHRGYKTKVVGQAGDMGVDVIASKGPEKYAIQVKRYSKPVSRTAVSDAVAGAAYHRCNAAMVVTNNYFTKGALALARSTNCQLVDRDTLAKWIAELG